MVQLIPSYEFNWHISYWCQGSFQLPFFTVTDLIDAYYVLAHGRAERCAFPASDSLYRTEPHSQTHCSFLDCSGPDTTDLMPRVFILRFSGAPLAGRTSFYWNTDAIPVLFTLQNSDSCIRHLEVIVVSTIHDWWVTEVKRYRIFHQDGFPTSAVFSGCTILFTFSFSTLSFIQGVPVFIGGSLLKGSLTHPWH